MVEIFIRNIVGFFLLFFGGGNELLGGISAGEGLHVLYLLGVFGAVVTVKGIIELVHRLLVSIMKSFILLRCDSL
jgi:hypothetical protein